MSKAGAGMTRAASFVGAASSNAYDVTLGATADVMLRTAHHTPILKNALACSVHRFFFLSLFSHLLNIIRVYRGFWTAYSSVREFIHEVLRRELSVNPANVYFTGHSLGMCLSLAAAEVFSVDVEIICVRWGYGDVRRLGLFYTFSKPYKQFFAIGPLAV